MGTVFGCHQERKLPLAEHRPCIGWAIDQKRRNTPSIALRLMLIQNHEAARWYAKLDDKAKGLFRSVIAMCRANGVRKRS